jgi:hydrogenase nickel incorporation protein HypA/HybF
MLRLNDYNMHEIRIAEDLAGIVLEVAGREKLSKVSKVNVSFGQLIQIVPDVFEFAFRESVRSTIASDAALSIEIIELKMECRKCKNIFRISENFFACQKCGSDELDILEGRELFVKSIEGE